MAALSSQANKSESLHLLGLPFILGCGNGEAMAMGERAPVALLDFAASGRLAVGEALTNIAVHFAGL
ncbi:hypothetical protein FK514_28595 [Klebsiella pneumoniae]|nr:hypothetical protein [Klebsiella pneumoniae]